MITLTNFKRKFEKMGYIADSNGKVVKDKKEQKILKEILQEQRDKVKNYPNSQQRPTNVARYNIRKLTGGVSESNDMFKPPKLSLKERLDKYKSTKVKSPKTEKVKINKSKLKLNKKLVLGGLVASGLVGLGINRLRKSRSDKGRKRGNYSK